MSSNSRSQIATFGYKPGRIFARKYEIVSCLGSGWEGEVYKIREKGTNIERAAKLFFPGRNPKNTVSYTYAKKLHRLRECPIVIQYHTQEELQFRGEPITALISEYVEGELLPNYLKRFPAKRLPIFQGIHLLHALATGVENIHHLGEYHGDLHSENILVRRLGLSFELKLIDLFHWGRATKENRQDDICDLIKVFYEAIGGKKYYAKHPPEVKAICCGLKRSLILKKFRTMSDLRIHLENQAWT